MFLLMLNVLLSCSASFALSTAVNGYVLIYFLEINFEMSSIFSCLV